AAYQLDASQLPVGYRTQEVFAGGNAEAAGVDLIADSVDGALWIALMAPQAKLLAEARATLAPDANGTPRALNLGLALAQQVPELGEDIGPRARLPMRYELTVAPAQVRAGLPSRVALELLADGSDGLRRSGVLRLGLPALALIGAPDNDPRLNPQAGLGDSPPRLDAEEDAARLIAWLRIAPQPEATVTQLRLSWAGLHAVELVQRRALPPRVLGVSDGGSDQSFDLGVAGLGSVDPDALRIDVHDSLFGSQTWRAIDDLGRAGPLDPVYRLDAEAGSLHFGDGVHGRVPSAGSQLVALGLFVGGGLGGNLPAATLSTITAVPDAAGALVKPTRKLDLRQPLALVGGADAETLDTAERRIPAYYQHRDRAVTAQDYRRLARETPGIDIGRVELLPRFKPHERLSDVPGVVSVMLWPARGGSEHAAPYPRADRPLLEAVHAFLDARRPLGTELYAIGCAYRPLGMSVAVQIADGHARETVLRAVREALRAYLWPLPVASNNRLWPRGDNDEGGYPLGRTLSDRELEVVAARVEGVVGVSPVRLFERSDGAWRELPGAGKAVTRFTLDPWELPELLALVVTEGTDAAASPLSDSDGDDSSNGSVFVPTVPELC
ncbi:MAG TPA: baseplate J/gp47 family protein, partial [Burkholderiaceae bacterium]|nr:baseplate J/gp47 family protein [Burkholderiaceae bacterium]